MRESKKNTHLFIVLQFESLLFFEKKCACVDKIWIEITNDIYVLLNCFIVFKD